MTAMKIEGNTKFNLIYNVLSAVKNARTLPKKLPFTVGQNQVNLFGNCFLLKNAWEYPLVVIFLHFFSFLTVFDAF